MEKAILGRNFGSVVIALLIKRKDREESRPIRRLLGMDIMILEGRGSRVWFLSRLERGFKERKLGL